MKFSLTFALTLAYLVAAAPQPRPENETRARSRSSKSRPTITSTASPEAASFSDVASVVTSSSISSSFRGSPSTMTRGSPALTQTSSSASPSATYMSVGGEGDVVGAVYFLTNVPDSNNIVVGTIGSDGNVTYAGAVFAGGSGQHGNDGGTFAADATFSNNLIVVHSERQLLAAANTKSNTIALFSVDPEDPSNLQMLGSPASSQGDFPNSLSFNKAGDKLCAVNAGEVANIMCFDVNDDGLKPQMDSIRPLPNYNQTTPPTGPSHTAGAIAFTPDEQNIVVVIKGTQEPPSSGYLSVWAVQDDGAIVSDPTVIQKDGASVLPFSLTPIPEQNAFLSSDLASAVDIFDLDGGAAKASKSAATDSISIDGDLSLCWSTYSPSLERFYLSAPPQSTVIEVAVDKDSLQPSVIASHVIPNQVLNTDIAVGTIGDKDFLFTLLTNDPGIAVLSLDGPGQTTLVGTAAFSDSLVKEGVPSRPNYSQGLALFMRP